LIQQIIVADQKFIDEAREKLAASASDHAPGLAPK
jgi:hypothetical protein